VGASYPPLHHSARGGGFSPQPLGLPFLPCTLPTHLACLALGWCGVYGGGRAQCVCPLHPPHTQSLFSTFAQANGKRSPPTPASQHPRPVNAVCLPPSACPSLFVILFCAVCDCGRMAVACRSPAASSFVGCFDLSPFVDRALCQHTLLTHHHTGEHDTAAAPSPPPSPP
jgi:hypothetical protein